MTSASFADREVGSSHGIERDTTAIQRSEGGTLSHWDTLFDFIAYFLVEKYRRAD